MALETHHLQENISSNAPRCLRRPLYEIRNIQTPKVESHQDSTLRSAATKSNPHRPQGSSQSLQLLLKPSPLSAKAITSTAAKVQQGGTGASAGARISSPLQRRQQKQAISRPVINTLAPSSALKPQFRPRPFPTKVKSSHALELPHESPPLLAKATASDSCRPQKKAPNLRASRTRQHRASIVPATNAQFINVLWKQVMCATQGTKSSEGKRAQGPAGRGRGTRSPRGGSLYADSETSSQVSRTTTAKSAKPTDADFYETVLRPRGIIIDGSAKSVLAPTHFSTSPPIQNRVTYYLEETKSAASRIWLDTKIESKDGREDGSKDPSNGQSNDEFVDFVISEYKWMDDHKSCEAEFATFAKEHLIRGGIRHRPRDERVWAMHRMVEVVTKTLTIDSNTPATNPSPWWSPPLIDAASPPSRKYTYDIRPDCQYWLSLNFANPSYKRFYGDYVYETGEGVCPYFTIEFKKDINTYQTAQNQLATAAALALYNRCILKHEFLQATRSPWSQEIAQSIRHYGLTFSGCNWQFWCVTPEISQQDIKVGFKWEGCKMSNLDRGKLVGRQEVEDFITWINEIHRWGITEHGKDCEVDVKTCNDNGASGVRTSSAVVLRNLEE